MSKPMKPKTTGLSAGPTAYWDARSDAAKDAEIKRLRELLREVLPYIITKARPVDPVWLEMIEKIVKEVGDD